MSITRLIKSDNFTVISNEIINADMTVLARFILLYYLSKPDGWHISNRHIQEIFPEYGRKSVTDAVNELIAHGYYKRTRHQRANGTWYTVVHLAETSGVFEVPELLADTDVAAEDEGDDCIGNLRPGVGSPTVGGPGSRSADTHIERTGETRTSKRVRKRNDLVVSTVNESTTKRSRPKGSMRNVAAEDYDSGSSLVGARPDTSTARSARERTQMRNPESPAGLAAEFAVRARDVGIAGPQQINNGALARNFRQWLDQGDTPEKIREMFDRFFESVQPDTTDDPAWRRFVRTGPKLRAKVTPRPEEDPDYYRRSRERDHDNLVRDAAAGDVRAQLALEGKDRPWIGWREQKAAERAEREEREAQEAEQNERKRQRRLRRIRREMGLDPDPGDE